MNEDDGLLDMVTMASVLLEEYGTLALLMASAFAAGAQSLPIAQAAEPASDAGL